MTQLSLQHIYERQYAHLAALSDDFDDFQLDAEISHFDRAIFALGRNGRPTEFVPEWSFEAVLQQIVSLGISCSPDAKHCYLECEHSPEFNAPLLKLNIGYRGEIAIATRFGVITGANATLVFANDVFEASPSMGEINHKIRSLSSDENVRGACTGGYCISTRPDGSKINTFMPIEEMDAIAQTQIEFTQGNTPWNSVWRNEMRRVALYRKASKDWRARINAKPAAMAALVNTQSA